MSDEDVCANTFGCSSQAKIVNGFRGAAYGLGGMLGLTSFWKPIDDSAYTEELAKLQKTKEEWASVLREKESTLAATEKDFLNKGIALMGVTQEANLELLREDTSINTLFIQILFATVIIIIFFLLI